MAFFPHAYVLSALSQFEFIDLIDRPNLYFLIPSVACFLLSLGILQSIHLVNNGKLVLE